MARRKESGQCRQRKMLGRGRCRFRCGAGWERDSLHCEAGRGGGARKVEDGDLGAVMHGCCHDEGCLIRFSRSLVRYVMRKKVTGTNVSRGNASSTAYGRTNADALVQPPNGDVRIRISCMTERGTTIRSPSSGFKAWKQRSGTKKIDFIRHDEWNSVSPLTSEFCYILACAGKRYWTRSISAIIPLWL